MKAAPYWALVSEVLRTGPADGPQILEHVRTHNLWEALYSASRSSPYAPAWREAFGRQRTSQPGTNSILLLAVEKLVDAADATKLNQVPEQERLQTFLLIARFIANCCAESVHNRRTAIHAGVLLPLLKSLDSGVDPNILVPTIYNVCADLEDPSDQILSNATASDTELSISIAEAHLAQADLTQGSVYKGLNILLSPKVVLSTNADILEYLAELVEMAAKPAIAAQAGHTHTKDEDYRHSLALLLDHNSGQWLANRSVKCRNSVCRALLAVSTSSDSKKFLASSGLIMSVALMPNVPTHEDGYLGDDEEERREIEETWDAIKRAMLKLTYEVAALPAFSERSKYGIARHSLRQIANYEPFNSYSRAVAYIMLYAFVDNEARATLLINEGLWDPLLRTLHQENDTNEVYPALSLTAKLATMWPLKAPLYNVGALRAVRRFLLVANMGFEVPGTAVMVTEMLIKGHPGHIPTVLDQSRGASILDDLFTLFDKGNDAICFEIGRLVIEVCATLATHNPGMVMETGLCLDAFAGACPIDKLANILIYMAKKTQPEHAAAAQRVWYALGVLATTPHGKPLAQTAIQDQNVQVEMQEIEARGGQLADNIKFLRHHLKDPVRQLAGQSSEGLDGAMSQLSVR